MNKEITINGEKYIKADCEECKEKKSPYEFKNGDEYYMLTANGKTSKHYWDNYTIEKWGVTLGKIFRTREEAEHERDKREAIFKIKKYIYDNFGYDPTDWFEWEAGKTNYFITFSYYHNCFCWNCHIDKHYSPIGYLKTEDQAQEIIDNFEDELKIIFNIK